MLLYLHKRCRHWEHGSYLLLSYMTAQPCPMAFSAASVLSFPQPFPGKGAGHSRAQAMAGGGCCRGWWSPEQHTEPPACSGPHLTHQGWQEGTDTASQEAAPCQHHCTALRSGVCQPWALAEDTMVCKQPRAVNKGERLRSIKIWARLTLVDFGFLDFVFTPLHYSFEASEFFNGYCWFKSLCNFSIWQSVDVYTSPVSIFSYFILSEWSL